jgi:hypothetical protein
VNHPATPPPSALLASILFAAACLGATPPKNGDIKIEKGAPVRLEQQYAYGHLPAELAARSNLRDEAGLCDYQFGLQVEFGYEQPRLAIKNVTATITSIKITLGLQSTIWLSDQGGQRIRDHEEAHRTICETYYRDANKVAFDAALQQLGRKITVPKSTGGKGMQAELEKIQQEIYTAYTRQIMDACEFAEKRFDEITDHSRKDIANADAIAQALNEEQTRKNH